ncbi:hypothetical protein [Comamonas serinivorans]|uniref:hypothetical protein n=1 Tax=Comamonas serinivorans TaxID=1082851 RepID=UPI0012F7A1AF|nr:hypothetical protein [Comamonas serinivorans]
MLKTSAGKPAACKACAVTSVCQGINSQGLFVAQIGPAVQQIEAAEALVNDRRETGWVRP